MERGSGFQEKICYFVVAISLPGIVGLGFTLESTRNETTL